MSSTPNGEIIEASSSPALKSHKAPFQVGMHNCGPAQKSKALINARIEIPWVQLHFAYRSLHVLVVPLGFSWYWLEFYSFHLGLKNLSDRRSLLVTVLAHPLAVHHPALSDSTLWIFRSLILFVHPSFLVAYNFANSNHFHLPYLPNTYPDQLVIRAKSGSKSNVWGKS